MELKETVTLWPKTRIAAVDEIHDVLSVRLDNGRSFPVDAIWCRPFEQPMFPSRRGVGG
jgi:hypothetical protein